MHLRIPNDELRGLFNSCIEEGAAPESWLLATLAAAPKKGKGGGDPAGYRNIGLESCLLKTLTFLIERRLREWARDVGAIPEEQNGFRAGFRTENNLFALRVATEQAAADGRTLWVAYVDIANAFPSVDHAALWAKLHDMGARGPILDWLRMLYRELRYRVRFQGEESDVFAAGAGILIGDPASPILWALFFSDFRPPPHPDDVVLDGVSVPYMTQADDILLMALSYAALQHKLLHLALWCERYDLPVHVPAPRLTACVLEGTDYASTS